MIILLLFFFIKYFNKKIGVLSEVAGVSIPIVFKPKARLLLQLGDQLIRNEKIAILELIKKSYDADAKNVTISMKNVENPKKGIINNFYNALFRIFKNFFSCKTSNIMQNSF